MQHENVNTFICFRGNSRMGGVIGEKVFDTLENKYQIHCFFSSASPDNRVYCENYREKEAAALKTAQRFLMIFTTDFFEGFHDEDEVLYEIRTALQKNLKLVAVAESAFQWTPERKAILARFLSPQDCAELQFLDYISYYGVREYSMLTERCLIDVFGLSRVAKKISKATELLDSLLRAQKKSIERFNLSSSVNAELARFGTEYTPSPMKINDSPIHAPLHEIVVDQIGKGESSVFFLIGDSGSGKSRLMQYTYDKLLTIYCDKKQSWLPLYLNLNGEQHLPSSRKEAFLNMLAKYRISSGSDAIIDAILEQYRFVFLFDALDERNAVLTPDMVSESISSIVEENEDIFVYSCRKNFYQYLRRIPLDYLVELLPFGQEQITAYCKNILSARNFDAYATKEICSFVRGTPIFGNILFLTYFLIYAERDLKSYCTEQPNDTTVLEIILANTIRREREKKNLQISLPFAWEVLKETAFLIFLNKYNGIRMSYGKLLQEIKKGFPNNTSNEIYTITEILISEDDFTDSYRFAHELFGEFLLAKRFADLLYEGQIPIEMLRYGYSLETNSYLTSYFIQRGTTEALTSLITAYHQLDKTDYGALLQVLNHMHRTMEYADIKVFALKEQEKCTDEILEILLLHTLLVIGDESDEEIYYRHLIENERFALLNSGITLSYYNQSKRSPKLPYYDDGRLSWYPIFLGYKKHILLMHKVPHYRRVLRINLFTAKKLIEIRRVADPEIVAFYRDIAPQIYADNSTFGQKIAEEYEKLLTVISKYEVPIC